MADDGSASNPRDSVKSSGWNVAVQRRRQQAVTVSKKIRELLIWVKRQCKVGTNGDDAAEMMIDEEQPILEAHTNIPVEELKSAVQDFHLPKELDHETIDTSEEIKRTSSMASSSSSSRRYDVFPSFSGEDVRSSFLSHLLKELARRLITTFIDHKIERSRPIGPELISAITESRIAIVVFSKKYASSTWCLNELVEIHKCYNESDQMVIPIFYNVDPSEVGKQKGEFGEVFNKTCEGEKKDKKQKWIKALADVANLAGEHLKNWPDEAAVIEKIANDVFNKLTTPPDDSSDFVGIEAHIEAMTPILCLESEEPRMVGIWGPSGIGKTTIASALFSLLSSQFHHHAFLTYNRTIPKECGMRLAKEKFLSEIMGPENIKIEKFGVVKERLKYKKVLIVLDDVDDLKVLNTLVGKPDCFGPGSRIIVITQDSQLLKAHEIKNIYEVAFPSEDLALKMLCQSAFGQNSPLDGFMELALKVVKLAGNLPLGLSVLGSSLKGRCNDYWIKMMPTLRNDLHGKIEEILRVGYDRLDHRRDQKLFLYLAFANLFNGKPVTYIRDLLGDSVDTGLKMLAEKSLRYSVDTGLKMLAEKSLIHITPEKDVEMHNLLQMLGKEIVRAESINEPGKRQFLEDVEDIVTILTNKTGKGTVLGIHLNIYDLNETLNIHKKAFKGMHNLQFLILRNYWWRKSEGSLHLREGLDCLPSNLRVLEWYEYPSKCLPFNFKAEFLVELKMEKSKLEKLWEGTQPIGSLKMMNLASSTYLKEIPDLSKAINLEELDLSVCKSLVTLPSIQNAIKLRKLEMAYCTKLESLPTLLNCKSLKIINLKGCFGLRNFPQIEVDGYSIDVEDCLWNKNLDGVDYLDSLRRCIPSKFLPEQIVNLTVKGSMLEKIWEGVQSLGSLETMDLSECGNLKEIPGLSNATNLVSLTLENCNSLVTIPDLSKVTNLERFELKNCNSLVTVPDLSKATNLECFKLKNCNSLVTIPDLSKTTNLECFKLKNCNSLVTIPDLSKATNLSRLTLNNCESLVAIPDLSKDTILSWLILNNCKSLVTIPDLSKATHLSTLTLNNCKSLVTIPDLPKATDLLSLTLNNCESLVTIPSTIGNLQNLKELEMKECIALEGLPTDVNLSSLKTLDLSGCKNLTSFPQISWSIKYLYLSDTAIKEVPSTIGNLQNLKELEMKECIALEGLPTDVNLSSLKTLDLSGCKNLTSFPQISWSIKYLYLSDTAIKEVPSTIGNLQNLKELEMIECIALEGLPTDVNLSSLEILNLSGCKSLTSFPQISWSIKYLYLSDTAIKEVPSTIGNLQNLKELEMKECIALEGLPTDVNLSSLKTLDLSGCKNLTSFPQISWSIKYINLNDTAIKEVPSTIGNLQKLENLDLKGCTRLEGLPTDVNLSSLIILHLSGCKSLRSFPQISWNIKYLNLNDTEIEEVPSTIGNLQKLENLEMEGCTKLKVLPTDVNLSSLKTLDLSGCNSLRNFPQISWSIEYLFLNDTAIKEVPSTFGNFQKLVILEMKGCTSLKVLPTDVNLSSLIILDLSGCKSLRIFPQISWSIEYLFLNDTAIKEVPSTVGNLQKLKELEMKECTRLEGLPTDVNLSSLETFDLSGCKSLTSFPQISWSIKYLYINGTAIEEVPCYIENFSKLIKLRMRDCKRLKNIFPNTFRLRRLLETDSSESVEVVTAFGDASAVETREDRISIINIQMKEEMRKFNIQKGARGRENFQMRELLSNFQVRELLSKYTFQNV